MTLLEECLTALSSYREYYDQKAERLFESLEKFFPFAWWGRIDWAAMPHSSEPENIEDALACLATDICLIFWDEASLPVVEARVEDVAPNICDVIAVSFDTWIVDPSFNVVVEFYHEGEIKVGSRE